MISINGEVFVATVRQVDDQGRVALPSDWRSRQLKGNREVVMTERDGALIIRARQKVDLTKFFDSVEVDVDPLAFKDYKTLKQALLKQSRPV